MNILYVSSFVYRKNSSAAIRNNKMIEGLVSIGNSVDVLTVNYSEEWTDSALLESHKKLGVSVNYQDVFSVNNIATDSSKKRLKQYLPKSFYTFIKNVVAFPDVDKKWLDKDIFIEDKYDIVISSSDTKTSHYVVEKIFNKQVLKAKWVQIWGDPWASDVNLDFFTKKLVGSFEYKLLKKAYKVFYVSELTTKEYKNKFPSISHKISYVGRPYYKKLFVDTSTHRINEFSIFYPGSLNENRSIVNFCENIKKFNSSNERQIKLNICGYQTESILELYQKYNFVHFLGVKSVDEVYSQFSESQFLLFVDNGVSSTQIPGKLFDYYGTNLPIIALLSNGNTIMKEFLSKDRRTIVVDKDNQDNLDFIFKIDTANEINEYYSPQSVAWRLLNEL
jgi:hypothetical protein